MNHLIAYTGIPLRADCVVIQVDGGARCLYVTRDEAIALAEDLRHAAAFYGDELTNLPTPGETAAGIAAPPVCSNCARPVSDHSREEISSCWVEVATR